MIWRVIKERRAWEEEYKGLSLAQTENKATVRNHVNISHRHGGQKGEAWD